MRVAGTVAIFPERLYPQSNRPGKGITIGLVQAVMKSGKGPYSERALKLIGEYAEYGDLRFKTPEEIKQILFG